ncbi:MAG: class I SAM-dependent methyltransferase [Patescibacteria group bacterium]
MKPGAKRQKAGSKFWNAEYADGAHLALSDTPSEDLIKFLRWLTDEYKGNFLAHNSSVLDLGVGNGRNLIYLAKNFGVSGVGYDISEEAIAQAKQKSEGLNLSYEVRSVVGNLSVPESSQSLVLDMMTSHHLTKEARAHLRAEAARVLEPGGWLYLKTFFRDDDLHARRLLKESPAKEEGSYIHPDSGMAEHVFTQMELRAELSPHFKIYKMNPSHRHFINGRAGKRRSISVYAQKI